MAIKFEKIKEGMTLYDVRRNTGMTRNKWSTWPVFVYSVDVEHRCAEVSWNGNARKRLTENYLIRLRAKKPKDEFKF